MPRSICVDGGGPSVKVAVREADPSSSWKESRSMSTTTDHWLTPAQVAALVGISAYTVRDLLRKQQAGLIDPPPFPSAKKFGGSWRVPSTSVLVPPALDQTGGS